MWFTDRPEVLGVESITISILFVTPTLPKDLEFTLIYQEIQISLKQDLKEVQKKEKIY